jgi:hypothetical protein
LSWFLPAGLVVQFVRFSFRAVNCRAAVVLESQLDSICIVLEIQHKGIMLLRMRSVQSRQGLQGLDVGEQFVNDSMQQRLVVSHDMLPVSVARSFIMYPTSCR